MLKIYQNQFKKIIFLCVIISELVSIRFSFAAANPQIPDAGSVLKQIEQKPNSKPLQAPEVNEPQEETPLLKEGEKVKIREFEFKNNKIILNDELKKHLAKYIGQELTFNELKLAVASISVLYKEVGYLVQATLPQQNITSGIIQIDILEADFGKTNYLPMPNNEKPNVNQKLMMDIIYPPSKEGEPLNLNRLERGILLANDLPGAGAGVQLMAGEKAGTTDIDVKIQNKSRRQRTETVKRLLYLDQIFHSTKSSKYINLPKN